MSSPPLHRILLQFYKTNLRYIPVIGAGAAVGGENKSDFTAALHGFLSRDRLDLEMSDLERSRRDLEGIPDSILIQSELPDDLIAHLTSVDHLPVLNIKGEQIASWEPPVTLRAIAIYRERMQLPAKAGDGAAPAQGAKEATSGGDWLCRLILSQFRYPLYVSDLQGRTLFYNEHFGEILDRPEMKRSIRFAEKYLLELTRNLLVRTYSAENPAGDPLRCRLTDLQLQAEIHTLRTESGAVGYLYILKDISPEAFYGQIEDLLAGEVPLEEIMDNIESVVIHSTLQRYGRNISHTAEALKIKRTTLQHKMKRLRLEKRFPIKADAPIPRRRQSGVQAGSKDEKAPPGAAKSEVGAKSRAGAKSEVGVKSEGKAKSRAVKGSGGKKAKKGTNEKTPAGVAKRAAGTKSTAKKGAGVKKAKKERAPAGGAKSDTRAADSKKRKGVSDKS